MIMYSLEEALEIEVSKEEAKHEIEKHQCSFQEFISEIGDKEAYQGSEVLYWLGY